MSEHPIFDRVRALPAPWRSHFPKSVEEAQAWTPRIRRHELARNVIALSRTRIECAWAAYIDAVPGENHDREEQAVLDHGAKLQEKIARILFPEFEGIPYAP